MRQEADRQRSFARRALLVGAGQIALFGALGWRLHQLQVREAERFRLLAEGNRISERLLPPARGRILDRAGRPLAYNAAVYRLRVVREQARDLPAVLDALARLIALSPARIDAVLAQARQHRAFVPLAVREDLTWDEVARVAIHTPHLPGVILDSALVRIYPHPEVTAHVLGYVGPPNRHDQEGDPDPLLRLPEFRIGKSGIEESHERELRGRAGLARIEVNALGREIRELERHEGEPGSDIVVSLDLELQRFCLERLSREVAASAVVMEVNTGAVVAMASWPSFDPRVFVNGLSHATWQKLRDDPLHPLVNKCIRGQYPPGSTFKMITALAALEAGVATHTSEVHCPGHFNLGNARFHCWKEHGHGRVALVQALAQSCDVYFYELARRVGIDALAEMANRFGIGEAVGIDLPGERPGLMPTSAWKRERLGQSWQRGETVVCGIGQGYVSTTPLQLAVMTARLCNGGKAVRPWLARPPGDVAAPADLGVDPARLRWVLQGMHEVVYGGRGTARRAALELKGIELAGKTGTSQVRRISKAERASGAHRRRERPREERDHALFVAYAPFDRPRYAAAVIVEHGESGARAAAPIAKDLMTRALEIDPAAAPVAAFATPIGAG